MTTDDALTEADVRGIVRERLTHVIEDLVAVEDTVDELTEKVENLQDRVTELERVVDPADTVEGYDQLTREQKVFKLRVALAREALNSNGRAAMKYAQVKAVFGNHPSPGHTYDLMEIAAEADGFTLSDHTGEKRLTVKTGAVNDDAVIRTANKTESATPA